MESDIIRFYSGTTQQLSSVTASNYIAFDKTTLSLSWCHNGTRYSILTSQNPDWNVTDPSSPAYIRNKPAINTLTVPQDLSQLSDATYLVHSKKQPITSSILQSGNKVRLGTRRPSELITSNGTMYSIQTDSLSLDSNNIYTIDLTRYMAYENLTAVPANGWYLLYNGGPVN